MTLETLKQRAEGQGFKYAYGLFKNPTEPPYLASICRSTENFMADNKVYVKDTPIQLDYIFVDKNPEEQAKIEDAILFDVAWNKTDEVYIENERVWQVSYYFELDNKNDTQSL